MKRRREGEEVTLDEETTNGADANPEEEEAEMSEEFKRFIEEKAKSTINSLFGNLLDIVDGKAGNPSPPPSEDKAGSDKIEDIEEAFASLQKSIRSMKIPESITTSIRQEFIASKQGKEATTTGKKSGAGARRKLKRDNFKVPSEKPSPAKSGLLNPITSDASSGSGRSSEKEGKLVTNYSCPFAPSCHFILTKSEMREMTKASQHLIKEHKVPMLLGSKYQWIQICNFKVTSEDTNAALRAKNQKYKFGKLKQMSA